MYVYIYNSNNIVIIIILITYNHSYTIPQLIPTSPSRPTDPDCLQQVDVPAAAAAASAAVTGPKLFVFFDGFKR